MDDTYQASETFVEVDVIPPLVRGDVPKPHMGDLMTFDGCYYLLGRNIRGLWINKKGARRAHDKTPVLHSSSFKIGHLA